MDVERITAAIRLAGGLLAYATLGYLLYGIWLGTLRRGGRTSGIIGTWLRSRMFLIIYWTLANLNSLV